MAVAVVAVLADLALGGLRLAADAQSATTFSHVTQLAVLGQRVTVLAQKLEDERDQTAGFVAAGRPQANDNAVNGAQAATNAAAAQVAAAAKDIGGGFPAATQAKVTTVVDRISDLSALRQAAVNTELPSLPVIMDYQAAILDLFTLNDEIAQGGADPTVADAVRALGDLSRAEEAASRQRALLFAAISERSFEPGGLTDLITAQSSEAGYLQAFSTTAMQDIQQAFSNQVTGRQVDEAQLIEQRVITTGVPQTGGLGLPAGNSADQWYTDMSDRLAKVRGVEGQLTSSIVARSQAIQGGPWQSALITILFMAAVLIFVLAATTVVARSLVLPLRRLKTGALDIATASLPARVKALAERADVEPGLDVQPIAVHSADEIGQVARAFDQVHAEALRLAGNEAIVRRNVSAMFVSLSHRSQTTIELLSQKIAGVVDRGLGDELQTDLAAMDRLLARMRRSCENLLVLAGYESVHRRTGPVLLAEVVVAAASGIDPDRELFLGIPPRTAIAGYAATDVTHMLAELVENAANFSPRYARITVTANEPPGGGVQIDVADGGVGMTQARLEEMNVRLTNPPVADALVSRHMGLFAVAHLAARHGARVRLEPGARGVVAQVWLPATITVGGTPPRPVGPPVLQSGPQPLPRAGTTTGPGALVPNGGFPARARRLGRHAAAQAQGADTPLPRRSAE